MRIGHFEIPVSLAVFLGMALAVPPSLAEDNTFDVMEYVIEGNTVLAPGPIEEAVYPFLGEGKSIKQVEEARKALEKAYHDGGYLTVFVDIPEQEVKLGQVRLRVTEGQVERLKVSGARYFSLGQIKATTGQLAEGSVPYFPEVQKELGEVNRSGDRRVTPVLRPGRSPGKVEVELKVEDKLPLHGSLELNDRYSANTTDTRLNAALRFDNLWQQAHSLSLNVQVAPEAPEESKVFSGTYVWPMANGDFLAGYGVISRSDVAALGDVNVIGNGNILGLRYIRPLRGLPDYFHTLTLGVDFKDFDETVTLQGSDSTNTPISYLPFSLAYEGNLKGENRLTQFNAAFNFALRGLGNNDVECLPGVYVDEFACKRFRAEANFAYLRLDLKHTQGLGAGWSLFGRIGGQMASGPLISNEQYSAGGVDSVRGYTESNSSGDDGFMAGLELRTPNLAGLVPAAGRNGLREVIAYAFSEGASLRVMHPLAAQEPHFELLSAGLGMRFKGWGGVYGNLDYAYPYRDAGQVAEGDDRLHFRLGYEW